MFDFERCRHGLRTRDTGNLSFGRFFSAWRLGGLAVHPLSALRRHRPFHRVQRILHEPRQIVLLCLVPAAYLLGSIPFGLLIALAKGKDPRLLGSKNIGATNVARALGGVRWFLLVFGLDMLKGLLPMLAAAAVVRHYLGGAADWVTYVLWLLVGVGAILGHVFSVFLGFKGGKGVSTSCGVMLGLFPYFTWPGLVAMGVWIVLFAAKRMVSLASIVAAMAFPVAFVALGLLHVGYSFSTQQVPLLVFALLLAAMIVYRHRENIARIRAGTESRFVRKET